MTTAIQLSEKPAIEYPDGDGEPMADNTLRAASGRARSRMKLGYNTNGLAHHRLVDAIELLADEGYESVAITLDAGALDPYDEPSALARQVNQVRAALDRRGLARVIETGARYLLNPRKKHDPTLMDPDPARRAVRSDFLHRAIDLAEAVQAEAVSLWSGAHPDTVEEDQGMERLAVALRPLLQIMRNEFRVRWLSSPSPACSSTRWSVSRSSTNRFATPSSSSRSTWGTFTAWTRATSRPSCGNGRRES